MKTLKQKEYEYYKNKYPELYKYQNNSIYINSNIYKYDDFDEYFKNQYPDINGSIIYEDNDIKNILKNLNYRNSQNYTFGTKEKLLIKTWIDFWYYKWFNQYLKNQKFKNNIKSEIKTRKNSILFLLIINIFFEIIQVYKWTFFNNFQFFLTFLLLILWLIYYSWFFFRKNNHFSIFKDWKNIIIVNLRV